MKKGFLLLLLIAFCLGVGKGLHYLNNGFSCRRLCSLTETVDAHWNEEVAQALSQTFHYLGRGRQCFAFASADDKYVLKLPRTDIYKTPFWVRVLPVTAYRTALEKDHSQRKQFVMKSFAIAFEKLQDQTAILALHLGQSPPQGKILTLIDKRGYKHTLPLEKTPFILQTKKPILMKTFSLALQKGDREEAKRILDAFVHTVADRAQKGILNKDRSFLRNYGYANGKAYQIDVGSFFYKPELPLQAAYEKSLRDSMDPVQEWLAQTDPEMLAYLTNSLNTHLSRSL